MKIFLPMLSMRRAIFLEFLFLGKQDGILTGFAVFLRTFILLDEKIQFVECKSEGVGVKKGDKILEIVGNTRVILSAERVVLNFSQRMTGVASYSYQMIQDWEIS